MVVSAGYAGSLARIAMDFRGTRTHCTKLVGAIYDLSSLKKSCMFT